MNAPKNAPKKTYEIEDVEISGDEATVTYCDLDDESGKSITVTLELEWQSPDPGVGIFGRGYTASGDAPDYVLDKVAEIATERAENDFDDRY